ncbi:MAG: hypothetical protein WC043_02520 [Pseudobdellovibrionaceae bacterium]
MEVILHADHAATIRHTLELTGEFASTVDRRSGLRRIYDIFGEVMEGGQKNPYKALKTARNEANFMYSAIKAKEADDPQDPEVIAYNNFRAALNTIPGCKV